MELASRRRFLVQPVLLSRLRPSLMALLPHSRTHRPIAVLMLFSIA
ncbi:hypothetical protein JAO29_10780 [Edaphobacter sp. HDX4]